MQYFSDCKTLDEAKKLFRQLCKELHPDHGGDHNTFVEMHAQFERFLKNFRYYQDQTGKQDQTRQDSINGTIRDIIEQIIYFEDCTIEIIGRWIWISGHTWKYAEELKAMQFWFSRKKKAWYWNGETKHRKVRGLYTMNQIRLMHGSIEIETKERKRTLALQAELF